ncbi:MAG: PASTA domain-containing protein, partial [Lachnospiraceae bacterium]|nr:PASTA domain-containing protein [Lachnospiraceae bacterium]
FNDPDEDAATRFISDNEMAQIKRQSERRDYMEETLRLKNDTEVIEEDEYPEEDYEDGYDPKMERITTILAVVAGLIICCVIIYFVGKITGIFGLGGDEKETPTTESTIVESEMVPMIKVSGMSVAEAQKQLRDLGLVTELSYVESEAYEQNIVISADITEGTSVKKGTTVTLTVSAGTEGREVPNVTGYSYEDAANQLAGQGFAVNKTESYSADVERGNVISQSPAGGKAPIGSVITVNVSLGQEDNKVRVPDLMGRPEDEAVAMLIEAGLAVTTGEVYSSEYELGEVCYQSYSYGSYVEPGTTVEIKVSLGAESVTYKYNASIEGPTLEEAPDYVPGTSVGVTIVADNGKVLLDTTTTTFPLAANHNGIPSPRGTITFTYTVTLPSTTTTDEAGATITIPGATESRTFTRAVEFVKE